MLCTVLPQIDRVEGLKARSLDFSCSCWFIVPFTYSTDHALRLSFFLIRDEFIFIIWDFSSNLFTLGFVYLVSSCELVPLFYFELLKLVQVGQIPPSEALNSSSTSSTTYLSWCFQGRSVSSLPVHNP